MGKPRLLTPALQAKFCDAVSRGATWRLACQIVGIAEPTFYQWRKRGKEGEEPYATFEAAVLEADGKSALDCLDLIKTHGTDHWQSAAWLLERRHGYRRSDYITTQEEEAAPLTAEDLDAWLDKIPPDRLRAALERATK